MSKTWGIVLVIAVLVVGGYLALKGNKSAVNEVVVNEETEQPVQGEKKIAFSEFVKQGGSYKCEVKQNVSDVANEGTVYISGGNMRGEFNTVAEGKTIDTTFIFKDSYMYTWSSALAGMGFKMKVDPTAASANGTSASGTYSWNTNQIGDYNCVAWTADTSKFTVPTSVKFTDTASFKAQQ